MMHFDLTSFLIWFFVSGFFYSLAAVFVLRRMFVGGGRKQTGLK